jgi:phosphoribosylglycinamide formyltransferase-1
MIITLCSGEGTTLAAVAESGAPITDVITNVETAPVRMVARRHNIQDHAVPHINYSSREEHEAAVLNVLEYNCQPFRMILLLGYMRIFSEHFLTRVRHIWPTVLMANLHPAPLSLYKGAHGLNYALAKRFPLWGVSVHEVTPELDSGPVIASRPLAVRPTDTFASLRARARVQERDAVLESIQIIQRRAQS